jgi:hypothetical protein
MRKFRFLLLLPVIIAGCRPNTQTTSSFAFALEVKNPLRATRTNVFIRLPQHTLDELVPNFDSSTRGIRVVDREAEIASEYVNHTLMIVLDSMLANETRVLNIYYTSEPRNYRKRTQAELSHKSGGEWKDRKYIGGQFRNVDKLRVPAEHKDHSGFIRYEGPGWESDKVAYRLYLDQRNAIDVFGKKTEDLVLMGVGQDDFNSYHAMQGWGMDIMKVDKSLGLGSLGMWIDTSAVRVENTDSVICEVDNGNLTSSVNTDYFGWKTPHDTLDLYNSLVIHGGTRWTLSSTGIRGGGDLQLATGIVKDKNARVFKSEGSDSTFGYVATYGKQSLNNDKLGLVIVFDHDEFVDFHEDAFSNIVELRSPGGPRDDDWIEYYLAAAWELEPNGIRSETDFIKWVGKSARELANPVIIHVK